MCVCGIQICRRNVTDRYKHFGHHLAFMQFNLKLEEKKETKHIQTIFGDDVSVCVRCSNVIFIVFQILKFSIEIELAFIILTLFRRGDN